MIKDKILFVGAKGGAKMCIDILNSTNQFELVGLVDYTLPKGQLFYGSVILGDNFELEKYLNMGVSNIVIAFSTKYQLDLREELIFTMEKMGFTFPNLIHSKANLEPTVRLGKGNIIANNTYLGSDVEIGNFNFFNPNTTICHDVTIGNNNHFSSGSVLSGYVSIKNNSLIGINTVIKENFSASDNYNFKDFTLFSI